jgi:SAM-dependent methyltransferase
VRSAVRERYGKIAKGSSEGAEAVCCAPLCADDVSQALGYSSDELADLPEGANLGLGCGNPQRIAELKPGETVLDLGSGGGVDCFLAARQVGPGGLVIGVDITPEMVTKARENARSVGVRNIEFRLGEIEHLPVADNTVDVIMSNCVINLAPDKRVVYSEAFRVLKPGGRLAISDVLAIAEMPEELKRDKELLCGCVSGALGVEETRGILADAGFTDIVIELNEQSGEFIQHWATGRGLEKLICAAVIMAVKPT